MKTRSNLERVLEGRHFAVTAEISPPRSADAEAIKAKVGLVEGYIDAFNIPDGQAAVVAMASWAAAVIGQRERLDPIVQMTCRDRNRIALEMDILGISALGVNAVLCISGDPISRGNCRAAKPVFDLDSIGLIRTVKVLRDDKKFSNGETLEGKAPDLFIDAGANPFTKFVDIELAKLSEKVAAGADFIQTQPVYDVEKFRAWMKQVRNKGLGERVKILAGITPITSAAAARFMKTKVQDTDIPEEIIERLLNVTRREQAIEEGINIAVETIGQVREIEGVAGVHIMTLRREELIPQICRAAGLHPRPAPDEASRLSR